MRKKFVAGNWKMNLTVDEAYKLASEIIHMYDSEVLNKTYLVLAPPFVHLSAVRHLMKSHPMMYLAAQNLHEKDSGAYTGEISGPMLRSVGCDFVIIGHSERRQLFQEDHITLAHKVDAALRSGLRPIFCVGETLEEREQGHATHVVTRQLKDSLFFLRAEQFRKVMIAYEPVWAIGTGKVATPEEAQAMHAHIRNQIRKKYDEGSVADEAILLYGGSVKPDNAASLFDQPDIDGALVGGASLVSRDFIEIIKATGE